MCLVWTGHCRKLAPAFEEAALELRSLQPPVYLAQLDATVKDSATANLTKAIGVQGYPTLLWFRVGTGRTIAGMPEPVK